MFLKIPLGLEQWTHSSSAPRELCTRASLALQQGFCFEIFPPTWLGGSPGGEAVVGQGGVRGAWPWVPHLLSPEAPGHAELAMPSTCTRAWVQAPLSGCL